MVRIVVPLEYEAIGELRRRFPRLLRDAVFRVAVRARDVMRRHTPLGGTGRLSSDVRVMTTEKGLRLHWDAPYASYVEEGAVPHWMTAPTGKGKQAYRFIDTRTGELVFAKKVDHPGQKKQPFARPAGEEVRDMLVQEIQRVMAGVAL